MPKLLRYLGRAGLWVLLVWVIPRSTETTDGCAFVALVGATITTVVVVRALDRDMHNGVDRLPASRGWSTPLLPALSGNRTTPASA